MPTAQYDSEQKAKLIDILRRAITSQKGAELEAHIASAIEKIDAVLEETKICFQVGDSWSLMTPASIEKKEIARLRSDCYQLAHTLANPTYSQRRAVQSLSMAFLLKTGADIQELPKWLGWISGRLRKEERAITRHHPTTRGYCRKKAVEKLGKIYLDLTGNKPGYTQEKINVEGEGGVTTKDSKFSGAFVELVEVFFAMAGESKSNLAIGEIIKKTVKTRKSAPGPDNG